MPDNVWNLIIPVSLMICVLGAILFFSGHYTLDSIKSKTVGDGQHGTARWATKAEMQTTFKHIPFHTKLWREGKERPREQGLVLGSESRKRQLVALVDSDDIHCLMIGIPKATSPGTTARSLRNTTAIRWR